MSDRIAVMDQAGSRSSARRRRSTRTRARRSSRTSSARRISSAAWRKARQDDKAAGRQEESLAVASAAGASGFPRRTDSPGAVTYGSRSGRSGSTSACPAMCPPARTPCRAPSRTSSTSARRSTCEWRSRTGMSWSWRCGTRASSSSRSPGAAATTAWSCGAPRTARCWKGEGLSRAGCSSGSRVTRGRRGVLLAGPGALWLFAFFLLPVLILLAYSFMPRGITAASKPGFTLEHYRRFFDPLYLGILRRTAWLALLATLVCLLLAYPIAYVIARSGRLAEPAAVPRRAAVLDQLPGPHLRHDLPAARHRAHQRRAAAASGSFTSRFACSTPRARSSPAWSTARCRS